MKSYTKEIFMATLIVLIGVIISKEGAPVRVILTLATMNEATGLSTLLIPGLVLASLLLPTLHILFSFAMSRRSKGKVWVIALPAALLSIVLWFACTMLWIMYYDANIPPHIDIVGNTLRLGDKFISDLTNAEVVFDGTLGLPYHQPATLLASLGISQGLFVPVSLLVWGSLLFGVGLLVAVVARHEKRSGEKGSQVAASP